MFLGNRLLFRSWSWAVYSQTPRELLFNAKHSVSMWFKGWALSSAVRALCIFVANWLDLHCSVCTTLVFCGIFRLNLQCWSFSSTYSLFKMLSLDLPLQQWSQKFVRPEQSFCLERIFYSLKVFLHQKLLRYFRFVSTFSLSLRIFASFKGFIELTDFTELVKLEHVFTGKIYLVSNINVYRISQNISRLFEFI